MEKYSYFSCFKDYWKFIEGNRFKFTFFTVIKAATDSLHFLIAFGLGAIVDFFTNFKSGDSLNFFYIWVATIAIAGILQVIIRFYAKLQVLKIAARVRQDSRVKAISNLMDLELKWHEKEETGSKIHKINEGGEALYEGARLFVNRAMRITIGVGGALILFATLSWKYALFASVYTALYLVGENYFNKKLEYWHKRMNIIREKISGKIHESASNLNTVKSLGLKNVFAKSASGFEKQYYDTWYKTRGVVQNKLVTIKVFGAIGFGAFVLMIGLDAWKNIITVGSILVYIGYFTIMRDQLFEITHSVGDFIKIKSAIGRFMLILGADFFDRESDDLLTVSKNWKQIEFKNVDFRYKDKNVLKNFNLVINRSDKIGIVGRSGSGKSTLIKLLLGLYKVSSGEVLIDGISVDKYKHSSVTKIIGVVLQDSEMFNMTMLDNITISSKKKDEKLLGKIIDIAQIKSLLKKLPAGWNTLLGEKGYKVSGGERQRVGLARALYKQGSLLILDEATSSLDSKTEDAIQKGLEKLDVSLIVIAHRLSTLKNVDQIIFMHRGKIVERGSFNQLVKLKGKFYDLYKLQQRK
jgi:ABC-type multidrug transport system fused ATPase/permease subunit